MNDSTQHHRHTWQQAPTKAKISDNAKTALALFFILAAYAFISNQDYEDAVAMEQANQPIVMASQGGAK